MTASAAGWIDLVAAMRELGQVVSADPPGTLAAHTGAPYRRGSRPKADADFVRALLEHLDLHHVCSTAGRWAGVDAASGCRASTDEVDVAVEHNPHDEVHRVDQILCDEVPQDRRTTTETYVQAVGRLRGTVEDLLRAALDEVEHTATGATE